jgi:hypothetical protein
MDFLVVMTVHSDNRFYDSSRICCLELVSAFGVGLSREQQCQSQYSAFMTGLASQSFDLQINSIIIQGISVVLPWLINQCF